MYNARAVQVIIRSQIEKNVLLFVVRSPDAVGVAVRFCLDDYCG